MTEPLSGDAINHLIAAVDDVRKLCVSEGNRWEGKHAATWQHWHARAGDMMTVSLALSQLPVAPVVCPDCGRSEKVMDTRGVWCANENCRRLLAPSRTPTDHDR